MASSVPSYEEKAFSYLDIFLIVASGTALAYSLFVETMWSGRILALLSFVGLIPVAYSAAKDIIHKRLSVDMLATIALTFSLLSHEWFSAAFITLMLAFARLFDRLTEAKAKRVIEHLLKYHVERVRIKIGDKISEVSVHEVRPGDLVVVESGDRMPVDGTVVSGTADVNEASLTGESELVQKKPGDKVSTATVNESGSLIVKAMRVGKDTTLSHIISLVDESSRGKNKAERAADRFAQWYISLSILASIVMYAVGLQPREILAVLLVVCADDIAVAVPLAFTIAMIRAGKSGVVVKGSTAIEELSKVKYILTDKTGTLTRGKPKVIEVKAYGTFTPEQVLERFAMGSSESRHVISRAIVEYATSRQIAVRAPRSMEEIPGQGIYFGHGGEEMLLGRASFMDQKHAIMSEHIQADVRREKDAGHGISLLAVNGEVAGLISYNDELRPHASDIIGETRLLGVREWHMLTGDNEKAATAVADELGIKHFHANMTPETKVEFVKRFENDHRRTGSVAYIGDGVNDAATLALADVSIAMGGIGSDAAIEAADITIMKDRLERVPEIMRISKKVTNVMRWNFAIWAVTNAVGLGLVSFGFIGPAGAATYNFLTDFIPIANAFRAGRVGKRKSR